MFYHLQLGPQWTQDGAGGVALVELRALDAVGPGVDQRGAVQLTQSVTAGRVIWQAVLNHR